MLYFSFSPRKLMVVINPHSVNKIYLISDENSDNKCLFTERVIILSYMNYSIIKTEARRPPSCRIFLNLQLYTLLCALSSSTFCYMH